MVHIKENCYDIVKDKHSKVLKKVIPTDQVKLYFDQEIRLRNKAKKRQMKDGSKSGYNYHNNYISHNKDDIDADLPASIPPASLQVSQIECVPNSDAESDSEVEKLSISDVLSHVTNISNIFKEIPINFNYIGVCECKQLCRDLGLHLGGAEFGIQECWEVL